MVCGPHRAMLLSQVYSAEKNLAGLPDVKAPTLVKASYKQAPINQGYQGSNWSPTQLYAERPTGQLYKISSTPMMSFVQPFRSYQGEHEIEHRTIESPDNTFGDNLENKLPRVIPRTSYQANPYQPQENVQADNATDRTRNELTKLFVEERNLFLEEKADNIATMLQPLYYPDVQQ